MNDSATQIVQQVRERTISVSEVVEQSLTRIAGEGARLNAFITTCEELSRRRAWQIDQEVAAGIGLDRPLLGVPVAVKDNICVASAPTTCGSQMLADWMPPYTAMTVRRMLAAGAILVGKTNLDEFGMGSSGEYSRFGPTLNPVQDELSPGGSSSGSAAAVGAGMVPLALGSDTGGSIRQPASFCDVMGFRPTYGAVSRYGLAAFASSMDQVGPLARTANDLRLALEVIAGSDENDMTAVAGLEAPQRAAEGARYEFAVVKESLEAPVTESVAAVVKAALARLVAAGHRVEEVSLPFGEDALAAYYLIAAAEASSNLARYDGVRYGYRAERVETLLEMYERSRGEALGDEVKRRILLGTHALSAGYVDEFYNRATAARQRAAEQFRSVFEQADFVVMPTAPSEPFRRGEYAEDPSAMYAADLLTVPASLAGLPAVSVPFGSRDENLPVGVQVIGQRWEDYRVLEVAQILEDLR
ncbi:Asp-tRNA(Asn)/Glu-tRNA(Gln) amidotransferase subunit GatA [candidate division GN15 bacterium]|nr:Asp-tRNA(Asn)/Glu-tRNA(Gln) amidotransferase subunit GatA [candidate division GN15 bacterium]